jgi:hypothetical protein
VDFGHGEAYTMAEVPSGFVGALILAPEGAFQLQSAHALLGFAQQKRGQKPFLQWEVRVIEHRAGRNGKLVVTALAVEQLLHGPEFNGGHLAAWALNTVGPAEPDKEFTAFVVGIEQVYNVN